MKESLKKVIGNLIILNSPTPTPIPEVIYFLMKPMLSIFQ